MKESFREGAVQSGKLAEHFKNPHCIIREVCNTEVFNVKNKQHMRILAELHVEIASLKRGGNETAALFNHSPVCITTAVCFGHDIEQRGCCP